MTPATVISHSGPSTTIVHSDAVAARVMQRAIKTGDGKALLEKSKTVLRDVPSQSSVAATLDPDQNTPQVSRMAAKRAEVRALVTEAVRALDDMAFAFDEVDAFRLMTVSSDDATVLAFAANVAQLRASGGQSTRADRSEDQALLFEFGVGRAKMKIQKHVAAEAIEVQPGAHLDFFVGSPADMLSRPVEAIWSDEALDLTFVSGERLTLRGADKAGSIAMRHDDQVVRLSPPKIPARKGLLDLAI